MSKVNVTFSGIKDTYRAAAATITTGWLAGQLATVNADMEITLAGGDAAIIVLLDGPAELSAPPTGSLVTGMSGTAKLFIDHKAEIAASDSTRVYESDVESASVPALLYASANGKWTTVASGSVKGSLIEVPTAANSRTIGIMLRM